MEQPAIHVEVEEERVRLDHFLVQYLEQLELEGAQFDQRSRSAIKRWITEGAVFVDGQLASKAGTTVKRGAQVRLAIPQAVPRDIKADPTVPFLIVHEDEAVLVVNKPPGIVVHPGAGNWQGTLVNGLQAYFEKNPISVGGALRPGIVHRLDKDTSGLLVVAKTTHAFEHLVLQFQSRSISRTYLALSARIPKAGSVLEGNLARHPKVRTKMAMVAEGGKTARTHWRVREELERAVLLELQLETGRTHQIRVHLEAYGAPIIGDPVYGEPLSGYPTATRVAVKRFARQALHAAELRFIHPQAEKEVCFEAALPEDMSELMRLFGRKDSYAT